MSAELVSAVIEGRLDEVRALIERGADPNHRAGYGSTPLFFGVTQSLAMTQLLLSLGADVHARSEGGFDVLHRYLNDVGPGSRLGTAQVAMVRLLLEAGLDVRARNGDQPHLLPACAAAKVDILEVLLAAGADPNASTSQSSALWEAVKCSHRAEVLATLVKGGLEANTRCTNAAIDSTILMEVCRVGDLESARLLLDRGADPNARGRGTPLTCAEESGNQVLVDLLLERGARPHQAPLAPARAKGLDDAQGAAQAQPGEPAARLGWARALLDSGFRAAAACEVAAAVRRGADVPTELAAQLTFERPAGVRWTFVDFLPIDDGVAPRTIDARFPGARVTNGVRTVPLVLTRGAPCNRCDELGEVECSSCHGTGSHTSYLSGDEVDCAPRERCSACRGLKFVVTGRRLGTGSCRHDKLVAEMKLGDFTLKRCPRCGLAAISGPIRAGGLFGDDFACGVCGAFECECPTGK